METAIIPEQPSADRYIKEQKQEMPVRPVSAMSFGKLRPGDKFGQYQITASIASGGMGEVYGALDLKLGRGVAIKVLRRAFCSSAGRVERFDREARVLASLNHPNIAVLYGHEDRALIMELVEGQTLEEKIHSGKTPLKEVLGIARQLAEALEYAHERGVIHRDLKPANIKLTPQGTVKVLDFGLATLRDPLRTDTSGSASPTLTMEVTKAGMLVGTVTHMSPEQVRGRRVDKRADIWAFGVVLYELLTGRRLFLGDTMSDTLAAVLTQEPSLEQVPASVRKLIRRCLAKDPKDRLRDIGEARFLLEDEPPKLLGLSRSWWFKQALTILAVTILNLVLVTSCAYLIVSLLLSMR